MIDLRKDITEAWGASLDGVLQGHLAKEANAIRYMAMLREEVQIITDLLCTTMPNLAATIIPILKDATDVFLYEPNRLIYTTILRLKKKNIVPTVSEMDREYRNEVYEMIKKLGFKNVDLLKPDDMLEYIMRLTLEHARYDLPLIEIAVIAHMKSILNFKIALLRTKRDKLTLEGGWEDGQSVQYIESEIVRLKDMLPSDSDSNASLTNQVRNNLTSRPPVMRTMLKEHDDLLGGGFKQGCFYIYAGRPGMGKTAVALKFLSTPDAIHAKNIFFSLEMPNIQLVQRLACSLSGVSNSNLNKLAQEWDMRDLEKFDSALRMIEDADHIQLIDKSPMTLEKIYAACEHHKASSNRPIGLVIVDYIQLVREPSKAQFREQEVAEISRGLKALAKQFNCAVIGLAQLNREVENRANKRPSASDLRESGSLEQDADVITMLYRDGKYNDSSDKDKIEMIVVKNRHGQDGTTHHRFIGETYSVLD
jgi:replicative DNA helicase